MSSRTALLTRIYTEVLHDRMGATVQEVSDGHLYAEMAADKFVNLHLYGEDPGYLQLIAVIDSAQLRGLPREQLREVCNELTARKRVVKSYIDEEGNLHVAVEILVAPPAMLANPNCLAGIMPRVIDTRGIEPDRDAG